MSLRRRLSRIGALAILVAGGATALATQAPATPYVGVRLDIRTETMPRPIRVHVVRVDLQAPGVRVALTGPGGPLETVRRTTQAHVQSAGAAAGINAHFFLPFPSPLADANLVGFAVSEGRVLSSFETPAQSYALVADAPAITIDPDGRASVVHRDPADPTGTRTREPVRLWTAVSGSAQIVTDGHVTIPRYRDAATPDGALTPGGPGQYGNEKSWYDVVNARTALGVSRDGRTLTLATVEARGGSAGMTIGELATMLVRDYQVWQALNLDGGGSTTLVVTDPATGEPRVLTTSADRPEGRAVGSSLLIFATTRGQEAARIVRATDAADPASLPHRAERIALDDRSRRLDTPRPR